MRKMSLLIVAVGLVAVSCSAATEELTEQILESQDGVSNVEIDEGSGQVSVETEDGSFTIGGGEVPPGFPFPFPDGYQVSTVLVADEGSSVVVNDPYDRYDELKSFVDDWTVGTGAEWQTSVNQITSAEGKEIRTSNWFSDTIQIVLADNCVNAQGVDDACLSVVAQN